ncbi:MAG: trigger factor [Candidatus Dependentiae bacterium]|nr:trigger factor [Candidatus Dependentiae bacterium]
MASQLLHRSCASASTENNLSSLLTLDLSCSTNNFCLAKVTIPASIISALYHEVSLNQQQHVHTKGFARGNAPLEYIQNNFKKNITEHLKEFLFKFCVINFLYKEIRAHKVIIAGEPRLLDIALEPDKDALFSFEFTSCNDLPIHEWKYLPFKSPIRKKYQDLDRQVELFIKTEQALQQEYFSSALNIGDWVNFNISINTAKKNVELTTLTQNFWFRLGNEKLESPMCDVFLGKKTGDIFDTDNKGFQDFFSNQLASSYNFHIEIVDTLPYAYFCLNYFKNHFKIKTNKDIHKKLIEVFSYRDDMSQRRSMVEESFKILLAKHQFTIPQHLALRQQKAILEKVSLNPDYNVYRKQKSFLNTIQKLAEKQTRESIFIDRFAYHENIDLSREDIKGYLNLINRPRTKEFIYFQAPSSTIHGQEVPVPTEEIKRICLREKAINHAIYHLTKK